MLKRELVHNWMQQDKANMGNWWRAEDSETKEEINKKLAQRFGTARKTEGKKMCFLMNS